MTLPNKNKGFTFFIQIEDTNQALIIETENENSNDSITLSNSSAISPIPRTFSMLSNSFTSQLNKNIEIMENHVKFNGNCEILIFYEKLRKLFNKLSNEIMIKSNIYANQLLQNPLLMPLLIENNVTIQQQSKSNWEELRVNLLINYQSSLSRMLLHPILANSKLIINRKLLSYQSKDILMAWFESHLEYP